MFKHLLRQVLPARTVASIRNRRQRWIKKSAARLDPLTKSQLAGILDEALGLRAGDVVFVHASMDQVHPEFPFYVALGLLREAVGPDGTLLFPTYPRPLAHDFLKSGEVFDVRKSPSYSGILSEWARRQRGAKRSLHPTKSVCALGPAAEELVSTHQESPFPYARTSPYGKLIDHGAKVIGIGVSTERLSFVHCVEDVLGDAFPVSPYHAELFEAPCIDEQGSSRTVSTYAHDMARVNHDIPRYMDRHVDDEACEDRQILGRKFFRASAAPLFARMKELAEERVTIYPKRSYRRGAT